MDNMSTDELYQTFQNSFIRVASSSSSPAAGAAVAPQQQKLPALNGYGDMYSQQQMLLPDYGNGWNSYPGGDLDFPVAAAAGLPGGGSSAAAGGYSSTPMYAPSAAGGGGVGPAQQQQHQLPVEPFYDPMSHYSNYGGSQQQMRPPPPQYPNIDMMLPTQPAEHWGGPPPPQQQQQFSSAAARIKSESSNGYVEDALNVMESISSSSGHLQSPINQHQYGNHLSMSPKVSSVGGGMLLGVEDYLSNADYAKSPSSMGSPSTPADLMAAVVPDSGRKRKGGKANSVTSSSTGGGGRGGGKRKKSSEGGAAAGAGPDGPMVDPEVRLVKDKERRFSNNTRERMRIRDINDALTELGRICMTLCPKGQQDKPQTKLGVLNMAVDMITNLEQKVRERNLNPSALCLQRGPGGMPTAPTGPPSSSSSASPSPAGNQPLLR